MGLKNLNHNKELLAICKILTHGQCLALIAGPQGLQHQKEAAIVYHTTGVWIHEGGTKKKQFLLILVSTAQQQKWHLHLLDAN